jgi:hypothetical protein
VDSRVVVWHRLDPKFEQLEPPSAPRHTLISGPSMGPDGTIPAPPATVMAQRWSRGNPLRISTAGPIRSISLDFPSVFQNGTESRHYRLGTSSVTIA